jgi:hypothetical protein
MFDRPPFYPHRENKDGTFDSVCLKCFATVARTSLEIELAQRDKTHICDPMFAAKPTRLDLLRSDLSQIWKRS